MHFPMLTMPSRRIGLGVAAVVAATVLLSITPAQASSIGTNGRIAYSKTVDGNADIYALRPDGSAALRLTTATTPDTMPAYSAGGQTIAFIRQPSPTVRELWTMKADGSGKRKVTSVNTVQTCPPAFSPDGKRLAFTQLVTGKRRIWTVAVDGTTKRQAFTPPPVDGEWSDPEDYCAKWSPKAGAGLAYIRARHETVDGDESSQIRINTGAADRAITGFGEAWAVNSFDFAPDGQQVVYAACCFAEYGLLVRNVDGSGGGWNMTDVESSNGPAWSPDGRYVAVGQDDGVYLLPVGGGPKGWLRVETQPIHTLSWQAVPR